MISTLNLKSKFSLFNLNNNELFSFFNLSKDFICVTKIDFSIYFLNTIGLEKLGFKKTPSANFLENFSSEDASKILELLKTDISHWSFGININLKNYFSGLVTPIRWTCTPIFDENDGLEGYIHLGSFIQIPTKFEDAPKFTEDRFQAALFAMKGTLWTNNADGKMEGEQRGWSYLTGQKENEYAGYGWTSAIHPEDASPTLNAWKEAVNQKKHFEFEHRLKKRDGEWGVFSVRSVPVLNEKGEIREWVGIHTEITKQKILDFALLESEHRFKVMAENTMVLIALSNELGFYTYFNKAWTYLTHTPLDELIGLGWTKLIHPDDKKHFDTQQNKSNSNHSPVSLELRIRNKIGHYMWIQFSIQPRIEKNNYFAGFICTGSDITELKESQIRLNLAIEATELGTWELELSSYDLKFSKRFWEIFGSPNNPQLDYATFFKKYHPDDRANRDLALEKAKQTGNLQYETRIVWDNKTLHWIEIKGKISFSEPNIPFKIIGTVKDITLEKNYENSILESREKFRLLADSMPQFVWIADKFGNLNYFNKAVYKYTELKEDELTGNGWIKIIHPDNKVESWKKWRHSISSGESFSFEHKFGDAKNQFRWYLSRAIPQKSKNGEITRWVGTSTDIQDLKELDELKDMFISMASHELKTPITTIKGYIQILQKKYEFSNDSLLTNTLYTLNDQINDLLSLLGDFLDLSKLKMGKLSLNIQKFDLIPLVLEIIKEYKILNPDFNLRLMANSTLIIEADKIKIKQVFYNLLSNAIKYSLFKKEIEIEIEVKVLELNEFVNISVLDFGMGISKPDQEKIFERFYRVEGTNEKKFSGFGIGLYLTSEIIKSHQGKLFVGSELGEGSKFSFMLPLTQ